MVHGGAVWFHPLRGDWETWNKVMPRGWNAGDTVGNIAIFVHLLLALVVTLAGLAQLVPAVRRARAVSAPLDRPRLHRLSIRYCVWQHVSDVGARGAVGDFSQHLGSTFNAILLAVFRCDRVAPRARPEFGAAPGGRCACSW